MDFSLIEERMEKVINHLISELDNIRAGRANPAILNRVLVDYYGVPTPINQLASINVKEARLIQVTPWDRGVVGNIEKAINKAELGFNPINDGNSIRLVFPEINEERRKELVKDCKKIGEESKVGIRNLRREFIDQAKTMLKNNEVTEDEEKVLEEKIQKVTDKYVDNVDKEIDKKEKEIMEV